ncbi:pirin family protein [Streptantibioticus ferralitis]|uniref:Pirin family protein n=1 Tax=Streptantibioticus ferralitis TaxID=236510 RepID=A0ABT5Z2C5_9ACTN|nr:pirin family protein [Streptantibioticus ferralitis]MDF2257989.1 pirin family protein [Streptantibioticus ferralitis]
MTEVRRSGERYIGGDAANGIETRHAFSFGPHYDPDNLSFGLLLACNEEQLAPNAGFARHPHRDVEIVTWVIEGELRHEDDAGHRGLVHEGEVQRLSAGSGVLHSERNASPDRPLRFVQMWLHPAEFGGEPSYQITRGQVVSPLRQPGAVLSAHTGTARLPDAPFVYVHVVHGEVRLGGETLGPGDSARVRDEAGLTAECGGPAEYLVWEMHGEPNYG